MSDDNNDFDSISADAHIALLLCMPVIGECWLCKNNLYFN